jgi:hypothetical protein
VREPGASACASRSGASQRGDTVDQERNPGRIPVGIKITDRAQPRKPARARYQSETFRHLFERIIRGLVAADLALDPAIHVDRNGMLADAVLAQFIGQFATGGFQRRLDRPHDMERMAEAVLDGDEQALQHLLSNSPGDDPAMLDQVALEADSLLGGTSDRALLIDD